MNIIIPLKDKYTIMQIQFQKLSLENIAFILSNIYQKSSVLFKEKLS
jgi:hypothetical protein